MKAPHSFRISGCLHRVVALLFGAACLDAAPATEPNPASPPPAASATVPPSRATFDDFRILGERDIFNPNRVSLSGRGAADAPASLADRTTLVGVLAAGQSLAAFFDSSNSDLRKVLHEGDAIAQFTVAHITNQGLDLVRDGKPLPMKVGQQLLRPPGTDWTVADGSRDFRRPAAEASATGAPGPSAPSIPADASAVLKRLMENRQKQLNQ